MKTFLAVFFGILAAVAVIAVIFGIAQASKEHGREVALRRSLVAARVRTIAVSCDTYKATYGGYPSQLADLGSVNCPAFSSPHCAGLIDDVLAGGKVDHYLVRYEPGEKDRRGRVLSYTATATRDPDNDWGLYNYFVDQSGVIRDTMLARPATQADPPLLQANGS